MDMVNNVEPLYNDKMAMFDNWVEEGDVWNERTAEREAFELAGNFAEAIESIEYVEGKYERSSVEEAAGEMMAEFEEYRDEAIKAAVEEITRTPKPEELTLDAGDIAHAEKYEEIAQDLGVDFLKTLIPASPEKIRKALERGDKSLNSIPLRKWDAASMQVRVPGLSLSEKVSALKHVAVWHYA